METREMMDDKDSTGAVIWRRIKWSCGASIDFFFFTRSRRGRSGNNIWDG